MKTLAHFLKKGTKKKKCHPLHTKIETIFNKLEVIFTDNF